MLAEASSHQSLVSAPARRGRTLGAMHGRRRAMQTQVQRWGWWRKSSATPAHERCPARHRGGRRHPRLPPHRRRRHSCICRGHHSADQRTLGRPVLPSALLFTCFFKFESCCRTFFWQQLFNVDAVYRALECGLWPPRPIGQWPSRVWPGWDQSPWPRSVWSGLSRFLNVLIPTRAALPNRPL